MAARGSRPVARKLQQRRYGRTGSNLGCFRVCALRGAGLTDVSKIVAETPTCLHPFGRVLLAGRDRNALCHFDLRLAKAKF